MDELAAGDDDHVVHGLLNLGEDVAGDEDGAAFGRRRAG